MLTDPLAVTFDGSAKSLPRVSAGPSGTVYRTADGEFEIKISDFSMPRDGRNGVTIMLTRELPDPTPSDKFDPYRSVKNSFSLSYVYEDSRPNTSVDIPLLRTALLNLVDTALQNRLIGKEK